MRLTAQQEYGLRCLLVIAKEPSNIFTISEIAKREALSKPYVAKLMRVLQRGGLIASTRGQRGGYRLVRNSDEIPLASALNCLGERLYSEKFCKSHAGIEKTCVHNSTDCSMRALWTLLDTTVQQVLDRLSLKSLLSNEKQTIQHLGKTPS